MRIAMVSFCSTSRIELDVLEAARLAANLTPDEICQGFDDILGLDGLLGGKTGIGTDHPAGTDEQRLATSFLQSESQDARRTAVLNT
jgi:hypothetical protein